MLFRSPDTKFIRGSMEFYCKSNEDMISKYSEQLKLLNINNIQDFDNLISKLSNKPYQEQSEFRLYLNKLLIGKTKKLNNYFEKLIYIPFIFTCLKIA